MKHSKYYQESDGKETKQMDRYWDKIRQEKYDGSFERTTKALFRIQNSQTKRKHKMKTFILKHKVKLAVAIFLAFIVGACNYPVNHEKNIGYAFSWTSKPENEKFVSQSLNKLTWLSNTPLTINIKNNNGTDIAEFKTVLQGIDEQTAMLHKNDLEKIKEINSVKVFPLTEHSTVPLYSAALEKFFRIEVSSSGKTEAEIIAEIQQQLKANGFENAVVSYENTGGHNKLMIKFPDNSNLEGKNMEVIVGGDGKEEIVKFKSAVGIGINGNMSDEEIKRKVIEDNPNLKPEEIKIIREGGKVKVEVEKEEIK